MPKLTISIDAAINYVPAHTLSPADARSIAEMLMYELEDYFGVEDAIAGTDEAKDQLNGWEGLTVSAHGDSKTYANVIATDDNGNPIGHHYIAL